METNSISSLPCVRHKTETNMASGKQLSITTQEGWHNLPRGKGILPRAFYRSQMDDVMRIPPPHCTKIFVQRDYSEGTSVKFQTKMPVDLEGKIERLTFESTVNRLNAMYAEAENLTSRTYCESCFACLTAYLIFICMDTYYEKMLKKIRRFIQEQNETVYLPRGLLLIDPSERGLRILEICILPDGS